MSWRGDFSCFHRLGGYRARALAWMNAILHPSGPPPSLSSPASDTQSVRMINGSPGAMHALPASRWAVCAARTRIPSMSGLYKAKVRSMDAAVGDRRHRHCEGVLWMKDCSLCKGCWRMTEDLRRSPARTQLSAFRLCNDRTLFIEAD
jgi:hypothetical protein